MTAVENLNSIFRYTAVNFVYLLILAVFFNLTLKRPLRFIFLLLTFFLLHALFLTFFLLRIPADGF